jgi:hypothetical protein
MLLFTLGHLWPAHIGLGWQPKTEAEEGAGPGTRGGGGGRIRLAGGEGRRGRGRTRLEAGRRRGGTLAVKKPACEIGNGWRHRTRKRRRQRNALGPASATSGVVARCSGQRGGSRQRRSER